MISALKRLLATMLGVVALVGVFGGAQLLTPQAGATERSYVPNIATAFQPGAGLFAAKEAKADCGWPYKCRARFWVSTKTSGPGGYSQGIQFCKDWQWADNFTTNSNICGSSRCWLWRGQYTKSDCHYADTDGIYNPAGYNTYRAIIVNNGPDGPWRGDYRTGYHKISGCFDCLKKIKQVR